VRMIAKESLVAAAETPSGASGRAVGQRITAGIVRNSSL
jgi:hypothetical protein